MNLTRQQLEDLYTHMDDIAKNSQNNEQLAQKSIRGTNRIIVIFTGLGVVLVVLILSDFFLLNKAISRSVDSMSVINKQVGDLQQTMKRITSSIANMGVNVEYLQRISGSVNSMSQETEQMNTYMGQLEQQTMQLGSNTHSISRHTANIGQNFSRINQSVGSISYSVNQAVKPIKQFMPLP
jgi:methyl-accepting chemotaxis protein